MFTTDKKAMKIIFCFVLFFEILFCFVFHFALTAFVILIRDPVKVFFSFISQRPSLRYSILTRISLFIGHLNDRKQVYSWTYSTYGAIQAQNFAKVCLNSLFTIVNKNFD